MKLLMRIPTAILSVLGAVLLWLCWPPFATGFLLPFAFIPWLLVIEIHDRKGTLGKANWSLMLGVFVWNFLCTWWVKYASMEGAIFMLAANTLLMTFFLGFYIWVKRRATKFISYLALISSWLTFEYMHLNWDGNFPWLNLGNGFSANPMLIQWYEYTGALGGTVWILLCSILGLELLAKPIKKNVLALTLAYALPILLSVSIYTLYEEKGEEKEVVIVQPNLDPYTEKFNMGANEISSLMVELAKESLTDSTKLLLLPETAIVGWMPETHLQNQRKVRIVLDLFHEYPNLSIITGAETYELIYADAQPTATSDKVAEDVYRDNYNTALLLERYQEPEVYHKSKLVPGPEKVPFIELFHFLERFSIGIPGSAGSLGVSKEPIVLKSKNDIHVAPLICYESVFGEYTGKFVQKGANLLVIITNDAWWESSNGHKHHFLYGAVRAIETRKDIARSGNTGISAFINQKGDVLSKTPWWEPATLKGKVRVNEVQTFYVVYGDYLGYIALGVFVLLLLYRISFWFKRS